MNFIPIFVMLTNSYIEDHISAPSYEEVFRRKLIYNDYYLNMAQNYYNFQNNRRGFSQYHPFEYSYGYPYEMEKEDERNQTSNVATQKGIVF